MKQWLGRKGMAAMGISLALTLVLSGCGGSNDQASSSPSSSAGAVSDSKSADKEPVKLKFTYWGSADEKKAIEGAAKKFTDKYPWITVETVQIPNADYNTKLTAMAAGNEMPDTGYITGDLGETWANEDRFVNLYEMLDKDPDIKRDDFLDYAFYQTNPDNAWGIMTAGEAFGLFYRKDLVEQAGVTIPSKASEALDWDSFVKLAQKLTLDKNGKNASEAGFDPKNIKQYGVMFETWHDPLNTVIFSNGGDWLSPDGQTFTLNKPESVEAIQKLADLVNVYHVAPSPLDIKSMPAMSVALQSGLVVMAIGGQWMNLDLGNAKVNYDIGVLPKLKESLTVATSGATVVFKGSKHPEEAWMLFKWMSNPEGAIDLYSSGLWMPTMKEWYTDSNLVAKWVDVNPAAHPPGFKDAMMNQMLERSKPSTTFYMKNQAKITAIVTSGLDQVWFGNKTAQEVLDEIAIKVKPEIKGRYDVKQ
ncbi:ABC transporter substrate-binding protein [Cohnella boryungensis]|uniref:ABC transporter substrate-binding protein n=1 Tax=Cohnella boryungensis TaxID=768479 RepID=A0ABV8SC25_9BACL